MNNKYYISIIIKIPDYRIALDIKTNYIVDFTYLNSINTVMGFAPNKYESGIRTGQNVPQIASSQMVFIVIDLIEPNINIRYGYINKLILKPI